MRHTGPRRAALGAVLGTLLALTATSAAWASEFPAGKEGYHSYTEVASDIAAVAAAHPDIVSVFSIGKSYQGRELWAAKVSDHVTVDEPEPEILFDGGTHADEHMSVEMTLHILHWLVDGYGSDSRITSIVNTREVWIVFLVNPDGAEYDIAGGRFHSWRKNRQPTPGTTAIGTDLNRNFGYRWGGGGRTSSDPFNITYRGPSAFSAPETRAMRAFLASRVVGGRQQIRAAITFHENGRLVMWPYGYTATDVPSDMTAQDHAAFVTWGRRMAATNGYTPQQASDLYVDTGTTRDYEYGVYRIFGFTFELSPDNVAYQDDSLIGAETGRNREAVLSLIEQGSCPLGVLGRTVRITRCGAFDDDFEVGRGWTSNPDGTDTAPAAVRLQRGNPAATSSSGAKQLSGTPSGQIALVTGAAAGISANANDLDGRTTARSPAIDVPPGLGQRLTFAYVFAHDARSSTSDHLQAIVERSDGTKVAVFVVFGGPVDVDGAWRTVSIPMDRFAGTRIHIRFEAVDGGSNNLIEFEVDDVRITRGG
jgi:carboxypeptidase T